MVTKIIQIYLLFIVFLLISMTLSISTLSHLFTQLNELKMYCIPWEDIPQCSPLTISRWL